MPQRTYTRRLPSWRNMLAFSGAWMLQVAAALSASSADSCKCWPLWEEFKVEHIEDSGRVRDFSESGERSISEAQAYTLFFALVADDKKTFERVLRWSDIQLANASLGDQLMSWWWSPAGQGVDGKIADANAATDADLWLAFSLIEAGRIWKVPAWESLGWKVSRTILAQAGVESIPGLGAMIKPGLWGFEEVDGRWRLNPSYFPPFLMQRLFSKSPDSRYHTNALKLVFEPLDTFGRAMDWVYWNSRKKVWQLESGWGSYDAIRVYLWLAMSSTKVRAKGCEKSKDWLALTQRQSAWQDQWRPSKGVADVEPQPTRIYEAGPGFTATAWALAKACNFQVETAAIESRFVQQMLDVDLGYYQKALLLFATGWLEGRFRFDEVGKLHRGVARRNLLAIGRGKTLTAHTKQRTKEPQAGKGAD